MALTFENSCDALGLSAAACARRLAPRSREAPHTGGGGGGGVCGAGVVGEERSGGGERVTLPTR